MPALKLAKLADRTPVKVTISLSPDLHRTLSAYADAYREAYGKGESLGELVPAMLASFVESDRAFARHRRGGARR